MAVYPVIAAGQRVTAGLLTSMQTNTIRKLQNTDRANNTMSDDPELLVALEANAVYFISMILQLGGNSTGDIRTAWTVPAGASGLKAVLGPSTVALETNADNITMRDGVHAFATVVPYNGVRGGTSQLFRVEESAEVATTAGGTMALNWAQVTTNATPSRVAAGSLMRVTRIG